MAKTSKKTSPAKRSAGNRSAGRGKPVKKAAKKATRNAKSSGSLTILALCLLGMTALWTLTAGSFAIADVFDRRAACQNWLVQAGRGDEGYRRVYDLQATRYGCSITKLGLKGYLAEKPIYPNIKWLLIVFGVPVALMMFYVAVLKLKRNWILGRKKKIWAKAEPIEFDDFEDMRDYGKPEEEKPAKAAEESKAAAALDETLAGDVAAGEPQSAGQSQAAGESQTAGADSPAPAKEEAPAAASGGAKKEDEEELSELEKILRQVDD